MARKSVISKWIELADSDFDSAHKLLKGEKYLHAIFFCQQAVEKYLKAFLARKEIQPLPIHNLIRLCEYANIKNELSSLQTDFLEELSLYYIKARYPIFKMKMAKSLSTEHAKRILNETKEMLKWIQEKNI